MDAAEVQAAVLVGLSLGAQRSLIFAAEHPERVLGLVLIGPLVDLALEPGDERSASERFHEDTGGDRGLGAL